MNINWLFFLQKALANKQSDNRVACNLNNLSRAIRMSLIESCQSLGIYVAPEATIQEIIDILKTQVSRILVGS